LGFCVAYFSRISCIDCVLLICKALTLCALHWLKIGLVLCLEFGHVFLNGIRIIFKEHVFKSTCFFQLVRLTELFRINLVFSVLGSKKLDVAICIVYCILLVSQFP